MLTKWRRKRAHKKQVKKIRRQITKLVEQILKAFIKEIGK